MVGLVSDTGSHALRLSPLKSLLRSRTFSDVMALRQAGWITDAALWKESSRAPIIFHKTDDTWNMVFVSMLH